MLCKCVKDFLLENGDWRFKADCSYNIDISEDNIKYDLSSSDYSVSIVEDTFNRYFVFLETHRDKAIDSILKWII